MNQLSMFSGNWISGKAAMPDPGQRVLEIYETEVGKPSRPVIGTPVLPGNRHLNQDGTSIYRRTLWWMPIPPIPDMRGAK